MVAPILSCFYGLCAVIAYNGLYTPLKKKTLLAIIPGCLSGMLPALIGWSVTGQSVWNFDILMLMGILGLWQIPHTFIILLKTPGRQTGTISLSLFYKNIFQCRTSIADFNMDQPLQSGYSCVSGERSHSTRCSGIGLLF